MITSKIQLPTLISQKEKKRDAASTGREKIRTHTTTTTKQAAEEHASYYVYDARFVRTQPRKAGDAEKEATLLFCFPARLV